MHIDVYSSIAKAMNTNKMCFGMLWESRLFVIGWYFWRHAARIVYNSKRSVGTFKINV